jgi:hypothetical protein
MSLSDTLRCDYPLPDPECQGWTFHTHDLGGRIERYRLEADGRLTRLRSKLYNPPRPHAARPAPEPEDVGYHGDLRFHAPTRRQVAYVARFTHGVVEWIRRREEEKPTFADSLERLTREARYLEQERQARLARWLQRLERLDPEVVRRAVAVFEDREDAALWLTAVSLGHDRLSPYEALALRKRQVVLAALDQMSGASHDRRAIIKGVQLKGSVPFNNLLI